jgi:hypothetical protein
LLRRFRLVVGVLAACGSVLLALGVPVGRGAVGSTAAALGGCPRHLPAVSRGAPGRRIVIDVPRDPVAGELCVYWSPHLPGLAPYPWRAVLDRTQARTLALLLDSRGTGSSCDGGSPTLARLQFRRSVFVAQATGCSPELLTTSHGSEPLAPPAAIALAGLFTPPLHPARTTATPGYVGGQLWPSALAARQHGIQVVLAEASDPPVPFDQVLWQTPLPGTPQQTGVVELSLIVATRPEPTCRSDQLAGRYLAGGSATQLHFGGFAVFDGSPEPCSLRGTLAFHGIDPTGQPDTNAVTEQIGPPVQLSPRASAPKLVSNPAGSLVAEFGFVGPDTAVSPNCRSVTPAAWSLELTGGAVLRVTNQPTRLATSGSGVPFSSCDGSIGHAPGAPAISLMTG